MAFGLNLSWQANNANTLVDAGFDLWVIEKETPIDSGTYVPIAPVQALPPITKNFFNYVFSAKTDDVSSLGNFRAVAYNSGSGIYDGIAVPIAVKLRGYANIGDIRAQGWTATAYPDAVVQMAIERASDFIDMICRQWFEPRYRRMSIDTKNVDHLWVNVPIIAINDIMLDETILSIDSFEIYNRHLTHGIVNPDDRSDPRIAWGEGRETVDIRRLYGGGRFPRGRKTVVGRGIFGYTEIGSYDYHGETADNSQIPISLGQTPGPIVRAATKLSILRMVPFEDADGMAKATKVISEKTRDQSYTLASIPESEAGFGFTGDTEIDSILKMFMGPIDVGVV